MKNGILDLLPEQVKMIHGPGCPVCVTPVGLIDVAIELALKNNVIICSYGDMLRMPGTSMSLLEAKSRSGDIRILYSPLEAVKIAKENPKQEVVFFAVGFETTAPANALSVIHAKREQLTNYSILVAHVLVPPAIEAIMDDQQTRVDGFLGAGHVCTIMGMEKYKPLVEKYQMSIVVTGFEPVDLLQGIYMTVKQLEEGRKELENQYSRYVSMEGNKPAQDLIFSVFDKDDREWRGIGSIQQSCYKVKDELAEFDAIRKYKIENFTGFENEFCIAGDVLKGIKKPHDCPQIGSNCTPQFPLGAPMVSSEGACAAYYHYQGVEG